MGAPALPENTGSSSNDDPTSHQDDPASHQDDPLPPVNQGSPDGPHNEPQHQSGDPSTDSAHDPGDTGNNPKPPNQSSNGQKPGNQDSHHGQSNTPSRPAVMVKGHTIIEGAAPVIIDGKPVIYSHGSVYVGGSGAPAPTPGPQNQGPAPVALEGFKFTPAVHPNRKKASNPAVIVQGQRVEQGAPPVTINGKTVQYSSGSVHVGDNAAPVPPTRQGQHLSPVIVGGLTVTPAPSHQNKGEGGNARPVVVVKGQTITENGPPATINGKPVVYSAGSIIAGGTRAAVPTAEPGKPVSLVNVAGLSFTPQPIQNQGNSDSISAAVVAGHTITEGAPAITVNGAKLAYSGGSIYVNGRAAAFPTPEPQNPNKGANSVVIDGLTVFPAPAAKGKAVGKASGIAIGGEIITPGPNGVIGIAGTTLSPDGPAVTISGTPISLNPSALVVGGSTYNLPPSATNHAVATVGGEIIYQNPNGALIVGQFTLVPGGPPVTISGAIFSLSASGGSTALVVGSSTIPLSAFSPRPTLNIFGQQVTANAIGEYVIAGKTLVPGGEAITVSGTKISLGSIMSDGKEIFVVGSSTSTILATTTTGTGGPGSQPSNGLRPTGSVASGAPGSSPTLDEASVTGEQASATEFPGRANIMSVNAMSIWLGVLAWAAYIVLGTGT